ncbi:hypothetical protein Dgeo_0291 [Deinococcus geothermalis DSM 11300]|uniref:Uncharacterized protein n=1 Tax=Deinococcus geothermalis (strain DSM 11300 / CIP 105573 / AG-3a) TaxID=319795 RepID=Q1J1P0_DEIGD|nr:hypothetical protein Dgeo_0291 [Deinococcus geothermalis DSM 11300]
MRRCFQVDERSRSTRQIRRQIRLRSLETVQCAGGKHPVSVLTLGLSRLDHAVEFGLDPLAHAAKRHGLHVRHTAPGQEGTVEGGQGVEAHTGFEGAPAQGGGGHAVRSISQQAHVQWPA